MSVGSRSSHWNVKVWGTASRLSLIGGSARVFTFKNLQTAELFHYLGLGYGFGIGQGLAMGEIARAMASIVASSRVAPPWANGWTPVRCFYPISANDMDLSSIAMASAVAGASASLLSASTGGTNYLLKARYSSDRNTIPTQTDLAQFSESESQTIAVSGNVAEARNGPNAEMQISAQHITLMLVP